MSAKKRRAFVSSRPIPEPWSFSAPDPEYSTSEIARGINPKIRPSVCVSGVYFCSTLVTRNAACPGIDCITHLSAPCTGYEIEDRRLDLFRDVRDQDLRGGFYSQMRDCSLNAARHRSYFPVTTVGIVKTAPRSLRQACALQASKPPPLSWCQGAYKRHAVESERVVRRFLRGAVARYGN